MKKTKKTALFHENRAGLKPNGSAVTIETQGRYYLIAMPLLFSRDAVGIESQNGSL
jgi:hypothetical protein